MYLHCYCDHHLPPFLYFILIIVSFFNVSNFLFYSTDQDIIPLKLLGGKIAPKLVYFELIYFVLKKKLLRLSETTAVYINM